MHRPLLLRGARQLLTLRGSRGPRRGAECLNLEIIHDGSVLIENGVILSVGPARRVDNLSAAKKAEVIEVHGAVVMPGFVDAWAVLPEGAAAMRRMLRLAMAHGSTVIATVAEGSQMRALESLPEAPTGLVPLLNVSAGVDEGQIGRLRRRREPVILRFDLHDHSRAGLRMLQSLGLGIRVHAAKGRDRANSDWLGLALAYGAGSVDLDAPLRQSEIALLAEAHACAVVRPGAAGVMRSVIDGRVAAALGSGFGDGPISTCSMQTAVAMAVRDAGIDVALAITLATINAAHALNLGGVCGSLEAGKRADMLVLHLSDYRDLPRYTGVNVVSKVIQAGKLV